MNVKEYIESGKLEAFILGALPPEEHARVQADIVQHAELAEEVAALEHAMEQYAQSIAKEPPPGMQDKIWNAIQLSANASAAEQHVYDGPKTVPIPPPEYRKPVSWAYAAVWIGLIGSVLLNTMLYMNGRDMREDRVVMTRRIADLEASQQKMNVLAAQYAKANGMMADTAMQTIVMRTVQKNHPMAATVYWNKSRGVTYVAMHALPHPPEGKQYQLWVMENGKPKSMGVLPNDMANTPEVQKMDMPVTSAEGFAISLENEGGNPTPTDVYVMGKI